ncbi:hypothetical protein MTR67_009104 [Solanum verrucosum]|uniref:Uncharacterized protein n=1 Tax=Solanum verrucosum TaxID=315347 RepID=A0AAF0Q2L7_SOLVR|nr:hypothetical protein MTR67_009104 [Solanum verrucosum]
MLIWGTCICIVIRCRPTGISTWNVRVCELETKQQRLKGNLVETE